MPEFYHVVVSFRKQFNLNHLLIRRGVGVRSIWPLQWRHDERNDVLPSPIEFVKFRPRDSLQNIKCLSESYYNQWYFEQHFGWNFDGAFLVLLYLFHYRAIRRWLFVVFKFITQLGCEIAGWLRFVGIFIRTVPFERWHNSATLRHTFDTFFRRHDPAVAFTKQTRNGKNCLIP